jgi:ribonuclease HI
MCLPGKTPSAPSVTDGSCFDNGEETARAGSGIWFGEGDQRNTGLRVPGSEQSNQVGELYAIVHALRTAPKDQALLIKTDSMYAIGGMTTNLKEWEDRGWIDTKHADLFRCITAWTRFRSNTTEVAWVKGHSGVRGNEEADKLAGAAATDPIVPGPLDLTHPPNMVPSGAKLQALSQKDFYRVIKGNNPPPPRRSTDMNLSRIQACSVMDYGVSPTPAAVWRSMRHKDLTKKTREFLWKAVHESFKIGKYWNNISPLEGRGLCSHCEAEESMEHILTECTAPGREQIWALANELWSKRSNAPLPSSFGLLLGCCLSNLKKENGKPDPGSN